ncbi:MAG: hypothetical protein JO367_07135, partial [Actinobacteria bacterium]|nr:hypothetical protein [Actinomycetota bacterium]
VEEARHLAGVEQFDWLRSVVEGFLAVMYARIATRELEASAGVALRNLGFVVKHALPARRRARKLFPEWELDFLISGRLGIVFLVNYEWAKLLAHEGNIDEAIRRLKIAIKGTDGFLDSPGRRDAMALLDSLG